MFSPPLWTLRALSWICIQVLGFDRAGETVEVSCHKLLVFTSKMMNALVSLAPSLAHRLYLQVRCKSALFIVQLHLGCVWSWQAAQTADALSEEAVAYEFLTQSFIVTRADQHPSQCDTEPSAPPDRYSRRRCLIPVSSLRQSRSRPQRCPICVRLRKIITRR